MFPVVPPFARVTFSCKMRLTKVFVSKAVAGSSDRCFRIDASNPLHNEVLGSSGGSAGVDPGVVTSGQVDAESYNKVIK